MWVVPHNGKYTYDQAVQICNGQGNMLTMADLSNSPRSYDYYNLTSADHISNSYTRKIGDKFIIFLLKGGNNEENAIHLAYDDVGNNFSFRDTGKF